MAWLGMLFSGEHLNKFNVGRPAGETLSQIDFKYSFAVPIYPSTVDGFYPIQAQI